MSGPWGCSLPTPGSPVLLLLARAARFHPQENKENTMDKFDPIKHLVDSMKYADSRINGLHLMSPDEVCEFKEERRRAAEEIRERQAREWEATEHRYEAVLTATTDPALLAVIQHHAPHKDTVGPYCEGCDEGAYAEDYPKWPCTTIELIEKHLGKDG